MRVARELGRWRRVGLAHEGYGGADAVHGSGNICDAYSVGVGIPVRRGYIC